MASNRILLHDISWESYEKLRAEEANWHVRMAYDQGELELMRPSQEHQQIQFRLGIFLISVARVLKLHCNGLRNTTWMKPDKSVAKEADGCFYLANLERVRHKTIDLDVDPPPDLAFEIEESRSYLDHLSIYAKIGIPEVWRFDGPALVIHQLQADGTYIESDRSLAIPCLWAKDVVRWLLKAKAAADDVQWMTHVEEWARIELIPRLGQC